MRVVIDADQLVYSCGFATEGEPISHTFRLLNNGIEKILKDTEADEYDVYIAGQGNFREDVAITQGYKANRVSPRPTTYEECREFLRSNWNATMIDGIEVDDKVSIELYQDYLANGADPDKCQVILSSPDKDLKNTPGWHYNPRTRQTSFITEKQALRHFYWQVLCGDNTDNIKGLPYCVPYIREKYGLSKAAAKGCGAGSATKLMSQTSDIDDARTLCIEAYTHWAIDNDIDWDDLYDYWMEQCQLLWMIREVDDFDQPVHYEFDKDTFLEIAKEVVYNGNINDTVGSESSD